MARKRSDKGSEFARLLLSMSNRYQTWQLWADFVSMMAISYSQRLDYREDREKQYLDIAAKYSKEEMQQFVKLTQLVTAAFEEDREQDYLGQLYMELELGNHWTGQFFTPYDLCVMMGNVTADDVVAKVEQNGYITMNDCACGAGATLVAGTNAVHHALQKAGSSMNYQNHVLVVAQDISQITALMCYIQLSVLGIAAVIKVGDSLKDPFDYDPLFAPHDDELWFTPMYFSDIWEGRRLARRLDMLLSKTANQIQTNDIAETSTDDYIPDEWLQYHQKSESPIGGLNV